MTLQDVFILLPVIVVFAIVFIAIFHEAIWNKLKPKITPIFRNRKQVPLWECTECSLKNGRSVWTWRNNLTLEHEDVYHDASNDPKYQEMIYQYEIDERWEEKRKKSAEAHKEWEEKEKRMTVYFKVPHYPKAIIKLKVPELLNDPRPKDSDIQIPLWVEGQVLYEDQEGYETEYRMYNLKGEYNFKEFFRAREIRYMDHIKDEPLPMIFTDKCFEYGAIDLSGKKTIPLSEVVYPRLSAGQIIHRNPYDGSAQKYTPTGHKVPSDFWTVFPGATPALFVLGLVALPMENGIPVVIGLFIFWCIGMYKNAEYKSFWEKEDKRQEDIRVQKISRMQSKKKR